MGRAGARARSTGGAANGGGDASLRPRAPREPGSACAIRLSSPGSSPGTELLHPGGGARSSLDGLERTGPGHSSTAEADADRRGNGGRRKAPRIAGPVGPRERRFSARRAFETFRGVAILGRFVPPAPLRGLFPPSTAVPATTRLTVLTKA